MSSAEYDSEDHDSEDVDANDQEQIDAQPIPVTDHDKAHVSAMLQSTSDRLLQGTINPVIKWLQSTAIDQVNCGLLDVEVLETELKAVIDLRAAVIDGLPSAATQALQNATGGPGLNIGDEYLSNFTQWDIKRRDLTDSKKYPSEDAFVDFRRAVWETAYDDEEMPDLIKWFDRDGKTIPITRLHDGGNNNGNNDDDDDDMVVAQEKKSYRCPLTMQYFDDPVTSVRCKHSFSRQAIMSMFSKNYANEIGCPVAGCNKFLRKEDLQTDNGLARKVQKIISQKQSGQNDDDEEEFAELED
ncbi:zinc-finger of the MIZ type in Nse subunit-domain-containing protein [Lipomyces japonicus]|uniref:zinc-finger of the MIZ type in Nse subunit-domain-containing protein n=1 Tax=Lipomyces japonicus TaxID=56871 RepID=UPI0034CFA2C1